MYGIVGVYNVKQLEEYRDTPIGKIMSVTSCGNYNEGEEDIIDRLDGWIDWMLLIMEEGVAEFNIEGTKFTVKKNDAVLIPPKVTYSFELGYGVKYKYMHFTSDSFPNHLGLTEYKYHLDNPLRLHNLIDTLVFQMFNGNVYHYENSSAYGMLVLIELANLLNRDSIPKSQKDLAMNVLNNGFRGSGTVAEYAKAAGMGEREFSEHIKKRTGVSPKEYIVRKRIAAIQERIMNEPAKSLKDIAKSECGYTNYQYFIRVFKRYTGMTPLEYRKEVNKKHSD